MAHQNTTYHGYPVGSVKGQIDLFYGGKIDPFVPSPAILDKPVSPNADETLEPIAITSPVVKAAFEFSAGTIAAITGLREYSDISAFRNWLACVWPDYVHDGDDAFSFLSQAWIAYLSNKLQRKGNDAN